MRVFFLNLTKPDLMRFLRKALKVISCGDIWLLKAVAVSLAGGYFCASEGEITLYLKATTDAFEPTSQIGQQCILCVEAGSICVRLYISYKKGYGCPTRFN